MKNLRRGVIFFGLLFCLYLIHGKTWDIRSEVRQISPPGYHFPSHVNKIISVGNPGLFADFLFLKTSIFYGERLALENELSEDDWNYIIGSLHAVTDLDPLFRDPYVFSQGVLAWDANKPRQAVAFLEKGFKHRPYEWRLPFYIGFDYYHLLGDYEKGAEYINKASKIPGSYSFLPALAARLYYYGDKSKTAIFFLKDMIATTRDPVVLSRLNTRLKALEGAALLEDLLERYGNDMGQQPAKLSDLIEAGYLEKLPEEPYGGQWIVLSSGRVFSTSRFAYARSHE